MKGILTCRTGVLVEVRAGDEGHTFRCCPCEDGTRSRHEAATEHQRGGDGERESAHTRKDASQTDRRVLGPPHPPHRPRLLLYFCFRHSRTSPHQACHAVQPGLIMRAGHSCPPSAHHTALAHTLVHANKGKSREPLYLKAPPSAPARPHTLTDGHVVGTLANVDPQIWLPLLRPRVERNSSQSLSTNPHPLSDTPFPPAPMHTQPTKASSCATLCLDALQVSSHLTRPS